MKKIYMFRVNTQKYLNTKVQAPSPSMFNQKLQYTIKMCSQKLGDNMQCCNYLFYAYSTFIPAVSLNAVQFCILIQYLFVCIFMSSRLSMRYSICKLYKVQYCIGLKCTKRIHYFSSFIYLLSRGACLIIMQHQIQFINMIVVGL